MKFVFVIVVSLLVSIHDKVQDSHTIYPCENPAEPEEWWEGKLSSVTESKMKQNDPFNIQSIHLTC